MKKKNDFDFIEIDVCSLTPKYRQLMSGVIKAIEHGHFKAGDALPSLNEVTARLELSRDSVERGYAALRKLHIIGSIPGKGFFIEAGQPRSKPQVCFLVNKLSTHKKIVYESFANALGPYALIDCYLFNNDFSIFKRLLQSKKNHYSHYVIMPHFTEGGEKAFELINEIPKHKLVLVDKNLVGVTGNYAAVYESFQWDIYDALVSELAKLNKYQTIKLLFPPRNYYPRDIQRGIKLFCEQYGFGYTLDEDAFQATISAGDLFIVISDDDLVVVLERIVDDGLILGKDVGVISYNEIPLKKILQQGITTVSTDFEQMGMMAARAVMGTCWEQRRVPFKITLRPSV